MLKFFLKKLGNGVLVVIGVIIVVFFVFHALPGDPSKMITNGRADKEMLETVSKHYGLNEPLHKQLIYYLNDISPLSFHADSPENRNRYNYFRLIPLGDYCMAVKKPYLRRSFFGHRLVTDILAEGLEGTFWLATSALLFAAFFGIVFGLIAALNHNTSTDSFIIILSVSGFSAPSFVVAVLMAIIFGDWLSNYTGLSMQGSLWETNDMGERVFALHNLILPMITLGIRPVAIITQLMRSSMLEVLNRDYIRTAHAKGLGKARIILKHALKNALNPVVTALSNWFTAMLAGSFFVEFVFTWKGLGYITLQAVQQRNFPVVMGATILVACMFVIVNIFVDILYAKLDPRVRLR